jgi:hypothetical protein
MESSPFSFASLAQFLPQLFEQILSQSCQKVEKDNLPISKTEVK